MAGAIHPEIMNMTFSGGRYLMGLLFLFNFRDSCNFPIQMLKLMSSPKRKSFLPFPPLSDLEGITAFYFRTMASSKDKSV